MFDIKKILVPVDFSEPSKKAVNYGLSLALQFNARLVLVHIVPSSVGLAYTFPTASFAFEREQADYAKSIIKSLVPAEYHERLNLETFVKVGVVQDEVLGLVKDEKIDLVVMGTHGRNAVERFLLGSLTERMLRKLPVPVLTVSHLDPTIELVNIGPIPMHRILYATDLSDHSEVGLKLSIELARGAGARLTVLHVFKSLETIYWGSEGGYLTDELDVMRKDTLKRLRESVPEDWCEGLKVTPVMIEGDPFREILRVAEEDKIDLVVLNLQSKSLVERALLGTTAERVIRLAHVPVLSIPVPADYAAKAQEAKGTAA